MNPFLNEICRLIRTVWMTLYITTLTLSTCLAQSPAKMAPKRARQASVTLLDAIHREYLAQCKTIPNESDGKSRYERESQILISVLRETCTRHGHDTVGTAIARTQKGKNKPSYLRRLESAAITLFAMDGKRQPLTQLLSSNCPEWLDNATTTEFALVAVGEDTLPDGILVLCDAFDEATNEKPQKQIVKLLRRAFLSHVAPTECDSKFVKECRWWYVDHKRRLVVNDEYRLDRRDNSSPLFLLDATKKEVQGQEPRN